MSGTQDVHALMEVIQALQLVAVTAKKAVKNGSNYAADVALVADLAVQFPVLATAIQDVKLIPAEAKDIQADEAVQIVQALYAAVQAVQAV